MARASSLRSLLALLAISTVAADVQAQVQVSDSIFSLGPSTLPAPADGAAPDVCSVTYDTVRTSAELCLTNAQETMKNLESMDESNTYRNATDTLVLATTQVCGCKDNYVTTVNSCLNEDSAAKTAMEADIMSLKASCISMKVVNGAVKAAWVIPIIILGSCICCCCFFVLLYKCLCGGSGRKGRGLLVEDMEEGEDESD